MTEDEMHKFFRDKNHARITGESSGSWGGTVGAAEYRERQQKEIAQRKKQRDAELSYARAKNSGNSDSSSSSGSSYGSGGGFSSGLGDFSWPRLALTVLVFVYAVYANYRGWPIEGATFGGAALLSFLAYIFYRLIFIVGGCVLALMALGLVVHFLG